jgi:asparagine synthase (glutamine-hydrolysing)
MCGIAGIARFQKGTIDKASIIRMRDSMRHRGPDDAGIYVNKEKTVALAHRRLSILDLTSSGHQPMSSDDENIWITYNGEIYNFPELRQELINKKYSFKSNTDTEVVLKAYQEWGEESFKKLSGMFAFCLFDKRSKLLYLIRDHAGIKPLYYSQTKESLIFASEVKAFKSLNNAWEENPYWRIFFLIFGHIPEPFTTLDNVFMLPKGSLLCLNIETGKYEIRRFIEIKFTDKIKTEKEAVELVQNEFNKSVKRHLISDAPIGVFLSGGIDSSLISLVASQFKGEDLRTLSVVFNEKEYSEERYQKIVHGKINSKHRAYLVTEKDFVNSLDDIFSAMDQPTIDGINTYFISKCAKEEGLKAVLSGLGGDELFGGYPSFQRIGKIWFLRNRNLKSVFKLFRYSDNDRIKKLSFLSIENPLKFYLLFRGLYSIDVVSKILDIDEKEIQNTLKKVSIIGTDGIGCKNFVSLIESDLYMKNQLLKDSDFMGMWHSVEIRVPFLDRDLMEYTFSIDENIKFNGSAPKGLLLKAYKDILPSEIEHRSKMGFTFPFQEWMRNNIDSLLHYIPDCGRRPVGRIAKAFEERRLHWSRFWALAILGKEGNNRI